jgi:hypothetical protein
MAARRFTPEQITLLRDELMRLALELAPTTVRSLYYQAVLSARLDFITKDTNGSKSNYTAVQSRVLDLRQEGLIAWESVIDSSRTDYSRDRWMAPADFAQIAPWYYRLDLWSDQPTRPIVLVEKDGQIPVYRDHAERFGVDVWACKGYASSSHLRLLALSIKEYLAAGQSVKVLVGADFDPSGCDWPRAAEAEIRHQLGLSNSDPALVFERELVTFLDVLELGAAVALRAANPNDSRTNAWLQEYGFDALQEVVVEMDAISPAVARQRMEQHFRLLYLDDFDEGLERQQQHRDEIEVALAGLV